MIPKFSDFIPYVLRTLKDEKECNMKRFLEVAKNEFSVSEKESEEMVKSGTQTMLYNRVSWSCTYLKQAGLIERVGRGTYNLSAEGEKVVASGVVVTVDFLRKYKSFQDFQGGSHDGSEPSSIIVDDDNSTKTPEEVIYDNYKIQKGNLADELLSEILSMKPVFLEKLVVDLLIKMGYGSDEENWDKLVTPYSNDGGIDGIISEDRLGLDKVYVQAKRYKKDNVIGTPQLDQFVGALAKYGAKKGVYITTSSFSKEAEAYDTKNDIKIVKIDGMKLCKYMIEYNLGVFIERKIEIKKLDENYFVKEFKESDK